MTKVYAVAITTIRETARSTVLQSLFLFVLLIIGFTYILGDFAGEEKGKAILDLGLAAIHLFGAIIAILIGVNLIRREIDRKTIQTILTKPINRWEFFAGKYVGFLVTLFLMVLLEFLALLLVLRLSHVPVSPRLLLAGAFIFLEYMLIGAVALLFSGFLPPAFSALLTASVFVVGHFIQGLKDFGYESANLLVRITSLVCSTALPDLEIFNYRVKVADPFPITAAEAVPALLIGLSYTGILLILGAVLFGRRRNFA